MGSLSVLEYSVRSTPMSPPAPTPIVFVVDDDISVRESLELLIRSAGWQPEIFASAQGLPRPPPAFYARAAWSSM